MEKEYKTIKWTYKIAFFVILALPVLAGSFWLYPPDFAKTIIFRSILAITLFLLAYQCFYKKNAITLPNFKKNILIWLLFVLFFIFLLATIFSQDALFSLWGSPLRSGGFVNFVFYIVFAILSFLLIKKDGWQRLWDFEIGIGILVSLVAFWQSFNGSIRPTSTLGNTTFLAIYLSLLFFITVHLFIASQYKIKKIFYATALAIFFLTVLITATRAAYLGILFGGIWFLFFYPKKIQPVKITAGIFFAIIVFFITYINITPKLPIILEVNPLMKELSSRLIISNDISSNRQFAWQISTEAIMAKPLLGFGPENFQIAFDKFYNPKTIPYNITTYFGNWWDRAHNIILDIGVQAGILGILAYFSLILFLFFKLQKAKKNSENPVLLHAIQATIICYVTANFFSFDSFATYLLFFFLIGYSLFLIYPKTNNGSNQELKKNPYKSVIITVSICVLIIFLWQYNAVPFYINAQITKAEIMAKSNQCDKAILLMDETLKKRSFLDSYLRIKYVDLLQTCATFHPENDISYAKKGIEIINDALKIQPNYSRFWLFLGGFTNVLADNEANVSIKQDLIIQAYKYIDHGLELAPRRQEMVIEKSKIAKTENNFEAMKKYSDDCINLNPDTGYCYFQKAISEIYLNNQTQAKNDLQTAQENNYSLNTPSYLQLIDAYLSVKNYQEIALIYETLIREMPEIVSYHSSLAFAYKQIGEYIKAKEQANIVLRLSPELKPDVEEFLRTLPY